LFFSTFLFLSRLFGLFWPNEYKLKQFDRFRHWRLHSVHIHSVQIHHLS
jgi:hypothetical protein